MQAPGSGSASDAAPPPAQFCCPLTLELMRDPVSLASGPMSVSRLRDG